MNIKSDRVEYLIMKQLNDNLEDDTTIFISDSKYTLPGIEKTKKILKKSKLNMKTYCDNIFDCDDFALLLKAEFIKSMYECFHIPLKQYNSYAVGEIWLKEPSPHALNFVINKDEVIRFIEPQKDDIYMPKSEQKGIYFVRI